MHPRAVTIVYMGDSITEGQYVEPALRWTDIISHRLDIEYLDTPINLLHLNRGISGETSRQGVERFPAAVQTNRPDLMTLQFGLNDCNCWITDGGLPRVSPAAFKANMIEMIERSRRFGSREIILLTNHPTLRRKVLLSGESLDDARKRYNVIVREIARKTGVVLCDIEKHFESLTDPELDAQLLPYPDHLHLSIPGHARYADIIKPLIDEALQRVIQGGCHG